MRQATVGQHELGTNTPHSTLHTSEYQTQQVWFLSSILTQLRDGDLLQEPSLQPETYGFCLVFAPVLAVGETSLSDKHLAKPLTGEYGGLALI